MALARDAACSFSFFANADQRNDIRASDKIWPCCMLDVKLLIRMGGQAFRLQLFG